MTPRIACTAANPNQRSEEQIPFGYDDQKSSDESKSKSNSRCVG
jgi:hypothetical protein